MAKPFKSFSKSFKKLPPQIRMILGGIAALLGAGLIVVAVWLPVALMAIMLEVPWVASGVSLAIFLCLLIPSNGWTKFGTQLFLIAVATSAFLDVPGNPIYNAPFEALFLKEGQYLAGHAIVENPSRGETVVSGNNIIVDADGNMIYDINDLWTFLYRLALYSVIDGTLLTLRGLFPKRSPEKKMSADTVPNA